MVFPRIASLKTREDFVQRLAELAIDLPCDEEVLSGDASPLGQPLAVDRVTIGNRFCILPMEGWDGTTEGKPTELTRRRWRNFGISGGKVDLGR